MPKTKKPESSSDSDSGPDDVIINEILFNGFLIKMSIEISRSLQSKKQKLKLREVELKMKLVKFPGSWTKTVLSK